VYETMGLGSIEENHYHSAIQDIPASLSRASTKLVVMLSHKPLETTTMIVTKNGGRIIAIYGELVEVVSKYMAETLQPHS